MSNPNDPNDPFAPRPERSAEEPGAGQPGTPPPYTPPPAPPYGQPPSYPQPPYGQGPAYGQAPGYGTPQEQQPGAYGAPQYPSTPSYGYPQQQYGAYAPYPKNNLGIWALVLGIASFVFSCFFVTGIPAIILGRQGQRAADEGLADNRGLSTAGVVLGWIAIGLSVLGVIFVVIAAAAGWFTSGYWDRY